MYNPDKHHRCSTRLRNYNYANAGAYFVTICLNRRIPKIWRNHANFGFPIFGMVENGVMVLNDYGKIVQQIWNEIPRQNNNVKIGEFVIMPDHIHGIIEIRCRGAIHRVQPYGNGVVKNDIGGFVGVKNPMFHNNLARIVRWFKGRIAFECRKMNCDFKWQRNYYEYIIRNETEYAKIAKYIHNNPILWKKNI